MGGIYKAASEHFVLKVDVLEAGKMGKRKDLSEFDKGQIVMARRLGQSISKTAALVGCSRSAVVSIYQKWSKEGTVVNRRQGHGRTQQRLTCVVRSNRRATVAQIAQEVNAGSDRKVSEYTVNHSLLRMWLHSIYMAPGCTMGRSQAGGGSVMLWAMFCWETLGPAIHVDVTLTRTTYLSIVADHVHSFIETVFPGGCGLFQQDNAPCHKAKMVQEWFEEHNNKFEVLTWPPNSPDLNPIEHLWDVLDKQV